MRRAPLAITGTAVITPLGDNPGALLAALSEARTAVSTLPELKGAAAGRLLDFEASRYANVRGMRIYSRATRLGICAARLALADAGLENSDLPPEQLGVVAGWSFGHLDTLVEYDRGLVTLGPQNINPALMPLALPSAPGAVTALAFGARAFSVTLSDGGASSLDALGLAGRLLEQGRARACVVVSSAAYSEVLTLSAWRAGLLCDADAFRVFDRASCGTAFGEAAAAVVLEPMAHAEHRAARPRGLMLAQASRFAANPEGHSHALRRAAEQALATAGVTPGELALVSASANGLPAEDRSEALALLGVLDGAAAAVPVTAVKAALGDAQEASGLVSVVAAVHAMAAGMAPPIVRLQQPAVAGPRYLSEPTPVRSGAALVTATSRSGACSALVVSTHA
jgi:3-oxoacyl-(acyl-carrier-protein) synthase